MLLLFDRGKCLLAWLLACDSLRSLCAANIMPLMYMLVLLLLVVLGTLVIVVYASLKLLFGLLIAMRLQ